MIEQLRGRVTPRMDDLTRELRAVILHQIQQPVTEETIQEFQVDDIKRSIGMTVAQMDPTVCAPSVVALFSHPWTHEMNG